MVLLFVQKVSIMCAMGQVLHNNVLFRWRQEDTSSFRLFNVDSSGRQIIKNFSLRHKLHFLLALL